MSLGHVIVGSANVWFGVSLLVFAAFRFARLRDGRGFRHRHSHQRHER